MDARSRSRTGTVSGAATAASARARALRLRSNAAGRQRVEIAAGLLDNAGGFGGPISSSRRGSILPGGAGGPGDRLMRQGSVSSTGRRESILGDGGRRSSGSSGDKPVSHHLVAYHAVQADPPASRTLSTMIRRFLRLVVDTFAMEDTSVPSEPHEVLEMWPDAIERASARGRLIFIVDGVDHLLPYEQSHSMRWIPNPLPVTVRFIVTTSQAHASYVALKDREFHGMQLTPLTDESRVRFTRGALSAVGVSLTDEGGEDIARDQLGSLLSKKDIVRSSFVPLVVAPLAAIPRKHYTEFLSELPRTIVGAATFCLQVLERVHGADLVRLVLSCLHCSRDGLSENDLTAVADVHPSAARERPSNVGLLLRALRPYLSATEDGRVHLSGQTVTQAVRLRYMAACPTRCPEYELSAMCRHIGPWHPDWDTCEGPVHALLAKFYRQRSDPSLLSKWDGEDGRAMSLLVYHTALSKATSVSELVPLLGDLRYLRRRVCLASVSSLADDFVDVARVFGSLGTVGSVQHFVRGRLTRLAEIVGSVGDADLLQASLDLPRQHVLNQQSRAILQQQHHRTASPYVEWINKPAKMDPCVHVLRGHEGDVYAVHLSADGAICVSGGADGTARVFNAESGDLRETLRGHKDAVMSVEVGADGLIATGGSDAKVLVWEPGAQTPLLTLTGHTGSVNCVRWSPSGRVLATCADDMLVQVWDVHHRRVSYLTRNCGGHTGIINSVCYSKDGTMVLSCSRDNSIQIRDSESGALKGSIQRVSQNEIGVVHCARFSRSMDYIVCGDDDGMVKLYRRADLELDTEYAGHEQAVLSVDMSPDGAFIVSASMDGQIRVWNREFQTTASDPTPKASYRILEGHTRGVTAVCFSPNNQHIASGSRDKSVRIWARQAFMSAARGGTVQSLMSFGGDGDPDGHTAWVTSVAFSSDSHKIVSGCADGIARTYSLQWGSLLLTLEGHSSTVTSVAWVLKRIVTASEDRSVRCWNAETGQVLHVVDGHTAPVNAVAMHPNARFVASGGDDHMILLVDTLKKQNIVVSRTMLGHRKAVTACAVLDKDLRVVSASKDNLVAIWDGSTGDMLSSFQCNRPVKEGEVAVVQGNKHYVTSLDLAPDGVTLVTGSTDKSVLVWDIANFQNRCVRVLDVHEDGICGVRFGLFGSSAAGARKGGDGGRGSGGGDGGGSGTAPGGGGGGSGGAVVSAAAAAGARRIFTASRDGTSRMWGGAAVLNYRGHDPDRWVMSVSAARGTRIATSSGDGTVRIWDMASGTTSEEEASHHSEEITCASAEGDVFITGSRDESIRVWDTAGKLITKLVADAPIMCCALAPDGKKIIYGCADHTVHTWNRMHADEEPTLVGRHDKAVVSCAFSRKGNMAISGCGRSTDFDGITAKIWLLLTGESVTLAGHSRGISAVTFSPDSQFAITASQDRSIRTWNAHTGALLSTISNAAAGPVNTVSVSLDGQRLLSGGRDGSIVLWSRKSGKKLAEFTGAHNGGVRAAKFSADGRRVVSCGSDGSVKWWAAVGHHIYQRHCFYSYPSSRTENVSPMMALAVDRTFSKVIAGDADGCAYFLRVFRV